jgi:hypothetical protein
MGVVLRNRLGTLPQSVIERGFVRLLEDAGLPLPELQHEVALPNGHKAYLDAAYPAIRLAWELDGHGVHATRKQRSADNTRAGLLADVGWHLRRFTYEQVVHDGGAVVRAVRAAVHIRSCDS